MQMHVTEVQYNKVIKPDQTQGSTYRLGWVSYPN